MDVFTAFPKSITRNWEIGVVQRATEQGDIYTALRKLEAIQTIGKGAGLHTTPSAATATSKVLLYVKPASLPTTDCATLTASYVVKDAQGRFYDITEAAEGYNQETAVLEHIELELNPTEVIDG